jgi:hypothetical protein
MNWEGLLGDNFAVKSTLALCSVDDTRAIGRMELYSKKSLNMVRAKRTLKHMFVCRTCLLIRACVLRDCLLLCPTQSDPVERRSRIT